MEKASELAKEGQPEKLQRTGLVAGNDDIGNADMKPSGFLAKLGLDSPTVIILFK